MTEDSFHSILLLSSVVVHRLKKAVQKWEFPSLTAEKFWKQAEFE